MRIVTDSRNVHDVNGDAYGNRTMSTVVIHRPTRITARKLKVAEDNLNEAFFALNFHENHDSVGIFLTPEQAKELHETLGKEIAKRLDKPNAHRATLLERTAAGQ